MLQKSAFSVLRSGANVFLTGAAGCGKTYLLNQYIEYLRDRDVKVAVTASTGIAATHIGGMTIHAWSGLGIRDAVGEKDLQAISGKQLVKGRVTKACVLIIDEVSMLSAQTLGFIDRILRRLRGSGAPFGGIQVIFSGDFFQLPPVDRGRRPAHQTLAFMAPVWVQANLKCCYLKDSYRHEDDELLHFLNEIRSGEVSSDGQDMLVKKLRGGSSQLDESVIKLHTHNVDVDAANARKLEELPEPVRQFEADTMGKPLLVESLKKSVMAPACLELKKGAKVMFVKNNPEENYANGTLGTVVDFNQQGFPIVETLAGHCIEAGPMDWRIMDETGDVIAEYSQIPLRLAWAITVHKSQGMTLDRATVDLSKTFEPGQGYVALSRVKNWDGLQLLGCNETALLTNSLARKADRRFQELSAQAEEELASISEQDLQQSFEQYILNCGGKIITEDDVPRKARDPAVKYAAAEESDTYEQTRACVEAGKNLAEIAAERGLRESTITGHLEKLHRDDPSLNLAKLRPPNKVVNAVRKAIAKCEKVAAKKDRDARGNVKLWAVYQELKGKYSYQEIKLARIFC